MEFSCKNLHLKLYLKPFFFFATLKILRPIFSLFEGGFVINNAFCNLGVAEKNGAGGVSGQNKKQDFLPINSSVEIFIKHHISSLKDKYIFIRR